MQTCLALHASYACRDRGDCCSAWEVPAETHVIEFVRSHTSTSSREPFFMARDSRGGGTQLRIAHTGGACVFRTGGACEIHRDGGESALPVSCRHFPRVILRDQRGTFTSLSHFCPTAAALLFQPDGSLQRVAAGPSLTCREPIEGMDAREALPPLLHPRMLADVEGYDAWERSVIDTLARAQAADTALDLIELATEDVRRWTPGQGSLAGAVRAAFATPRRPVTTARHTRELGIVRAMYLGDVSLDLPGDHAAAWHRLLPDHKRDLHRAIANYLAARRSPTGSRTRSRAGTVVAWLRACHDVLRAIALSGRQEREALTQDELLEAIRLTDLIMLHSIDSHAFATRALPLEQADAA